MIPDLSKCGLSLDILNLDAANKAIEDAMKELSGAAGGIAGNIANLQSQLEGEMNKALAQLENLIPEIPDLPPNLQLEMAKLIGLLNDPLKALDLAAQLDKIKKLFGDAPGLDLDALLGDLNALLSFDICKDIPNLDAEPIYDEFGFEVGHAYIKKGLVPEAPVVDAIKLPLPTIPKTIEEVTPANSKTTIVAVSVEAKKAAGVTVKPAQKILTPPSEKIYVEWPALWQDVLVQLKLLGMDIQSWETKPVPFQKGTSYSATKDGTPGSTPEGGAEFWQPAGVGGGQTQTLFEEMMLSMILINLKGSSRSRKLIKETDLDVLETLQSRPGVAGARWVDENWKNLNISFIKMAQNNLPKGQTYTLSKGVFTVSRDQALKSAWPKPPGTFGKYSVLV